jgi:hypothetical protein
MSTRTKALVGAVVWTAFAVFALRRGQPQDATHVLLAFAVLVVSPLLLERLLAGDRTRLAGWVTLLQLPAAVLLTAALVAPPGAGVGFAALPWLVLTLLLAVAGVTGLMLGTWRKSLGRGCASIATIYSGIGGLWVFADRVGLRPLGFDPEIVALTAVHFHFAGWVLPALTGFVIDQHPESRLGSLAAIGVVLGVPAVAMGITLAQLGWGPAFEAAAGCGLALAGMAVAILQVRLAMEARVVGAARLLLIVSGASLFIAMFLSAAYALRATAVPVPRLDLGAMRALHGVINAAGFALCGILGWRLVPGEAAASTRGSKRTW